MTKPTAKKTTKKAKVIGRPTPRKFAKALAVHGEVANFFGLKNPDKVTVRPGFVGFTFNIKQNPNPDPRV
jgi:hypothetical protein